MSGAVEIAAPGNGLPGTPLIIRSACCRTGYYAIFSRQQFFKYVLNYTLSLIFHSEGSKEAPFFLSD